MFLVKGCIVWFFIVFSFWEELIFCSCRCGCSRGSVGVSEGLGVEFLVGVGVGEERCLGRGVVVVWDRFWVFLEVLLWSVSQVVLLQIIVLFEYFVVLFVVVGFDVCMGEKVSFQIIFLIKGFFICGIFVWRFLFRCEVSKGLIFYIIVFFLIVFVLLVL